MRGKNSHITFSGIINIKAEVFMRKSYKEV